MSETHEFLVELKPGVPHSDTIQCDLDTWVGIDEPNPGQCQWSRKCKKLTVHNWEDDPDSFWSEQIRLELTSFSDILLTGDEIRAALRLMYCQKHVTEAREHIASVKLSRRSMEEDSEPTCEPTSSNNSIRKFGSDDLKGSDSKFDFESTGPSASLAPFKAGDGNDTSTLDAVSKTRTLEILPDGSKRYPDSSQSTREGLKEEGSMEEGPGEESSEERGSEEGGSEEEDSEDEVTPSKKAVDLKTLHGVDVSGLSPNQTPRRGRRTASFALRARLSTPKSSAVSSPYGELAWATMKGDISYEDSVASNAQKVASLLLNWQGFTDSKATDTKGWVYIVRDPELDLVKIGSTQNRIGTRVRAVQTQCKATSHDWKIIRGEQEERDQQEVPIYAYKLLEKLVQADLAPHRWYFECACGLNKPKIVPGYTQHQEWFDVSDQTALATLQLWRSFLLQMPFDFPSSGGKLQLNPKWHKRLSQCQFSFDASDENHDTHELRLDRWRGLLDDTALKSRHIAVKGEEVAVKGEEVAVKDEEVAVKIEDMEADTVDTNAKHGQTEVKRECDNDGGNAIGIAIKPEPAVDDEKTSKQVPSPLIVAKPTPSIAIVLSTPQYGNAGFASQNGSSKTLVLGIEEPAPAVDHEAPEHHTVLDESSRRDSANSTTSVHPSEQLLSDHSTLAPSANATITATEGRSMHLDFDPLFRKVTALLNTKKPSISERTILEDLISLRWPLACLMAFALHGPYVPATLSVFMWTVFLPFFIAELRGWY
ncbi:hypothetical protein LTR27_000970 [Elasticomyces elasticus]|nr:hypothetical protein LTR27_000970 [Elasticomyces elasticus]